MFLGKNSVRLAGIGVLHLQHREYGSRYIWCH